MTDSHGQSGILRLFRVGVKNVGGTTIDRVAVDLQRIEPVTAIRCPVRLHIMHDNSSGVPHRREFPLDTEHTEYIDVVQKGEWPGNSGTGRRVPNHGNRAKR